MGHEEPSSNPGLHDVLDPNGFLVRSIELIIQGELSVVFAVADFGEVATLDFFFELSQGILRLGQESFCGNVNEIRVHLVSFLHSRFRGGFCLSSCFRSGSFGIASVVHLVCFSARAPLLATRDSIHPLR